MESVYPGIAIQALGLTVGTLLMLLGAYRAGLIKATKKFRSGVIAATGAIFLVYMATWIMGMFGMGMPMIHEGGIISIVFSGFIVVIAALNLVLDFDFIERGAKDGLSKRYEWIGAFGLVLTLVWLYIEILRLLSYFRD